MRTITIVFNADETKKDWHWIYESMKTGRPINGLNIFAVSNGNVIQEIEERDLWDGDSFGEEIND